MNSFCSAIEAHNIKAARGPLTTLQVNMGDLCNQSCAHCHVAASPGGKNIMLKDVVDMILAFLNKNKGLVLDITGGAPELNPHFEYLVAQARPSVKDLIVRSNLTVLLEPGKEHLVGFLKENKAHLICSLPCYTQQNVDAQRGTGVFVKSIRALCLLNDIGYARDAELLLDIVYNPSGAFLPGSQAALERDYRANLAAYGVSFSRLITITNVLLSRFKELLEARKESAQYVELLKRSFNPAAAAGIMCRSLLSVGFDGRLYDCDFNQALGLALTDKQGRILTLAELKARDLDGAGIIFGEHCFSCAAGQGSSCQGALAGYG